VRHGDFADGRGRGPDSDRRDGRCSARRIRAGRIGKPLAFRKIAHAWSAPGSTDAVVKEAANAAAAESDPAAIFTQRRIPRHLAGVLAARTLQKRAMSAEERAVSETLHAISVRSKPASRDRPGPRPVAGGLAAWKNCTSPARTSAAARHLRCVLGDAGRRTRAFLLMTPCSKRPPRHHVEGLAKPDAL